MQPCLQAFTTSIFCFLYLMVSSMQMWKGNISSCAMTLGQEKIHTQRVMADICNYANLALISLHRAE